MENQELIQQVTEKASKWLTPAYDAETQAEVKRMLLNGCTNISQAGPRLCCGYTDITAFFCDLYQTLPVGRYLTNEICSRSIGKITFINGGNIHIDNISIAKNFFRVGDTVANHIIDTYTYTFWITFI